MCRAETERERGETSRANFEGKLEAGETGRYGKEKNLAREM